MTSEYKQIPKDYAETLEAIVAGDMYLVAGEPMLYKDVEEYLDKHPNLDMDDVMPCTLKEYLEDRTFNIEYRCNEYCEYVSVRVCITWKGPRVYVDTGDQMVHMYWGSEHTAYRISYEVCKAFDMMNEYRYEIVRRL